VTGIQLAIANSKGKKIYVLNLMTKYGQTTTYTAKDHVEDLEQYVGKNQLDVVLVNKKTPTKNALAWYKDFDEHPVVDDLNDKSRLLVVRKNLIKDIIINIEPSDSLRRSIIRHDSEKLAKAIMEILDE
jgi:uncharacterized cofD-like protein